MRAGREDVALEAEVVCSVRMVVFWAMQALVRRLVWVVWESWDWGTN
jgi:hypothetical protein